MLYCTVKEENLCSGLNCCTGGTAVQWTAPGTARSHNGLSGQGVNTPQDFYPNFSPPFSPPLSSHFSPPFSTHLSHPFYPTFYPHFSPPFLSKSLTRNSKTVMWGSNATVLLSIHSRDACRETLLAREAEATEAECSSSLPTTESD